MFKYLPIVVCFPFTAVAQQANQTYYAAPYLQIEKVNEKAVTDVNDFGYNILVHPDTPFIKEGFFMWVDDQWYEILNSKEVFKQSDLHTLFTIAKNHKDPLKIKDVNDVVYLYPIEALDSYIVSYNDFIALSKSIEKKSAITYTKPIEKPSANQVAETQTTVLLDVINVVEVAKNEQPITPVKEEIVVETELPKLNANEPVLITSEEPASVLLDVIDIVEVVKREEIPFDPVNTIEKETITETTEIVPEETTVKETASNTPIIKNPSNDYEIAVNEGFDGTVTEWIEMIDAKGGKSAYQQAIDKGYVGTEEEWMKMLWGREVDVEIAKRDKTTAIVTEWIQSLKTSRGNSPYEMALKHGFYGTFTEWVESVVGTDGEKAYEHAKTKGFEGSYKDWIEEQLNNSNKEVMRKERLTQTQMFVAPNVFMPVNTETAEPLTFDLYAYYNQFYGSAMVTSAGANQQSFEILPTDLEYQITWFEKDKIKILELSKNGILKYQPIEGVTISSTKINIRYILK